MAGFQGHHVGPMTARVEAPDQMTIFVRGVPRWLSHKVDVPAADDADMDQEARLDYSAT